MKMALIFRPALSGLGDRVIAGYEEAGIKHCRRRSGHDDSTTSLLEAHYARELGDSFIKAPPAGVRSDGDGSTTAIKMLAAAAESKSRIFNGRGDTRASRYFTSVALQIRAA